jgi:hypothetical protein
MPSATTLVQADPRLRVDGRLNKTCCTTSSSAKNSTDKACSLQAIASVFDDYCIDLPEDSSDECAISGDETGAMDKKTGCTQCRGCNVTGPTEQNSITYSQRKRGVCRNVKNASTGCLEEIKPPSEHAQCVSQIQGPLMSLWPIPLEHLELEWNERFYE